MSTKGVLTTVESLSRACSNLSLITPASKFLSFGFTVVEATAIELQGTIIRYVLKATRLAVRFASIWQELINI